MATEDLGTSLTGTYTIHGGTAYLYERGVVVNGVALPARERYDRNGAVCRPTGSGEVGG